LPRKKPKTAVTREEKVIKRNMENLHLILSKTQPLRAESSVEND
jgi:hypothetical protein